MEITSDNKKKPTSTGSKILRSRIKAIQKSLVDLSLFIPGCPDEIQGDLLAVIGNLQTQVASLSEDFSSRRQREKAFRELQQRHRALFENAGIAMAVIEENGILSRVNDQFAKMSGYGKKDLEGKKTWREFIVKEDLQRLEEYHRLRTVAPEAAPGVYEARGVDRSGNPIDLLITIERFPGTLQRIASFNDLTEYKKIQNSVKRMEASYRTIFDSANDAFLVIAPETKAILDVNQKMCEIYGYTPEEARMLKAEDISANQPPYTRQEALIWIDKARKGTPQVFEWRAKDKAGRLFWVEVSLKQVIIDDKKCIFASQRDITARKHLDERFRQSQKMEAIGRLASGVAHDFNNMLAVIAGNSGVMLSNLKKNNPLFEPLMEIKKAGEKASLLTQHLLAFGRKQVLAPRIIDLNHLVGNMGKMLGRIIGRDIELEVILSPDPLPVFVDGGQMDQVLMNMAINARDAMPKGGKLSIQTALCHFPADTFCKTCGQPFPPRHHVVMSIRDTGMGIQPQIQPMIFEPFFTTKHEGKGTGLGLSTVQGTVHQSGGHIDFFSRPKKGTIFYIYLPKAEQEPALLSKGPGKR